MIASRQKRIGMLGMALLFLPLILGCGQTEEDKSKIKDAVEKALSRDLKLFKGAKKSLEKIEKETLERNEKILNQ